MREQVIRVFFIAIAGSGIINIYYSRVYHVAYTMYTNTRCNTDAQFIIDVGRLGLPVGGGLVCKRAYYLYDARRWTVGDSVVRGFSGSARRNGARPRQNSNNLLI